MWRAVRPLGSIQKHGDIIRLPGQLLVRKTSSNLQQASTSEAPKSSQSTSQEVLAKPSGLKRTRRFLWRLVGVALLGYAGVGGVVGYCWYDKKFRDQLEQNVPGATGLLEYFLSYLPPPPYEQSNKQVSLKDLYQEEKEKRSQGTKPQSEQIKTAVESEKLDAKPSGKASVLEKSSAALVPAALSGPPAATVPAAQPVAPLPPAPSKAEVKRQEREAAQAALREKEREQAAQNEALDVILTTTLNTVTTVTREAVEAQHKAAEAARLHTQRLRQAMDAKEKEAEGLWTEVMLAADQRTSSVVAANQASEAAREQLEKLRAAIREGRANQVTKQNKTLASSEDQLNKLNYNLTKATVELTKAESEANIVSEYRDIVRKGREQFRKEVESIVPDMKLGKGQGGKMTEDDLNALIAHAHRRIEQLQRQLAEQLTMETQKLEQALDRQRQQDEQLAEHRLEEERKLLQNQLAAKKSEWEVEAQVEFEAELRRELGRQAAAHSDHLTSVLKVQERELEAKYNTDLRFQLMKQNDSFHRQVAQWVARLRGIEAAVTARADLEKQGLRSQELWVACQALSAAILHGNVDRPVDRKPLTTETEAIVKAASSHPFVSLVVSTLPETALQQGIYTEEALTARFDRVQRICRRVAMIDETGGTLFRYFLSYLQSLIIFSRAKTLAENDIVDVESLSTFDIVDTAHHALLAGNIELALRLMNQLRGEPRRVASDWIREARLLLEARQASETLLSFAGASGVGAIY